jgi:hypothetical protein
VIAPLRKLAPLLDTILPVLGLAVLAAFVFLAVVP